MRSAAVNRRNLPANILRIYSFLVYGFLFIPIMIVVMMSFSKQKLSTFPIKGLTLEWYEKLFHNASIWSTYRTSLIVALISTLIAVALGLCASYAIVRYRFRFKSLFIGMILAPMLIPAVITGISLLLYYNFIHIKPSIFTVILGHVTLALPYTSLIITARLQGFNISLEEAARNLGASEPTVFRKIVMPLIAPGIIGGALFALTISLDEFALTFFINSPSSTTLPIKIWSMLRFGITPELNALSTVILFISLVIVAMGSKFQGRK